MSRPKDTIESRVWDEEVRGKLQATMGELCRLYPDSGVALFVFPLGDKPGLFHWIANADRADMVKTLREQADRLEAGMADTRGRKA